MTKTTRLNDLQLILLSSASQRENGSLLPPPDTVAGDTDRIAKAIPPLIKRQLVEEAPIANGNHAWREQDQQPIGLYITDAGRSLIAADELSEGGNEPEAEAAEPEILVKPAPRAGNKNEQVIAMLRRPDGATITEMMAATGWLPHSTRAVLTGLRKKGHAITRDKRDDQTCYRIAEVG